MSHEIFDPLLLGLFELLGKCKEAMSRQEGDSGIPEEAAKSALCACYYGLLWDLNHIQVQYYFRKFLSFFP